MSLKKSDMHHCIGSVHSLLKWQQPINLLLSKSLMLIKQQNTKINPYLIYTVNTIVLFNI